MYSPTLEDIQKNFTYNPTTGEIFSLANPTIAVGSSQKGRHIRVGFKDKTFLAHRLAWVLYYGTWPEKIIDHIDGNGRNNRIKNLRQATHQQNTNNKTHYKGRSGVKGIYWSKQNNSWHARLFIGAVGIHLGYSKDIEKVKQLRAEAAKEWLGEFYAE